MRRVSKYYVLVALIAATVGLARADVPKLINFQGQLLSSGGTPVTTATSVVFRLFTAASGGSSVFSETQTVTPDSNGIYHVLIGQSASLSGVNFNADLWLEVEVAGETLTPRFRFGSAPYSLRSSTANSVAWTGITGVPAGFADGVDDTTPGASTIGSFHIINGTITVNDLADAAVTTAKLADNAVTSAKVVDGSIVNADIAAGAAIALSKLEKDPSTTGTINNSTNPVDWTKLKSVPAGFADGVDNTGGTPDPNSVGTTQIIDSTITASDLASDSVTTAKIADGTVVNADIAAGAAIALSKLEKDPSTTGTINNSTNPVDWTKLKSVPAGFADGVDNTGGTPDPNSVGTTQIIDSTITANDLASNSVTTAKIADGTVVNADIAAGAAIALSKLEKDPSIAGTINNSTNPVDWTKLKSVPAGFADGVDNTGGTPDPNSVGTTQIIDSTITASDLASNSVTTAKIADTAVTTAKLADNSVGTAQIIDSTITANDLASNAVTTTKIADSAVTSAKVADGTVVNADIAAGAAIALSKLEKDPSTTGTINNSTNPVDWTKLKSVPAGFADGVDNTGGTPDPNSVGTAQIIDSTITASDLASNSVTTTKIADAAVTTAKLADNSVGTAQIIDSTITANDLASNAVTTAKIADSAVTSAKVADGTVVNTDIAAGAAIALSKLEKDPSTTGTINNSTNPVDWTKLKSVPLGFADGVDNTGGTPDPNTVGTTQIIDSTITASDLASNSVTTAKIADDAVTTAKLADNSVGTAQIIDSTITANDLAANAVTTAKVVDGAITSAKVADGTVVNADIAAGAAIALSKLERDPSIAGTINNSTNPVDWTKLKSVPAGFADGVDNTGGTPDPNSVGTTQIIDSTITANDLASNSVTTAKIADAAVTTAKLAGNSVGTAQIIDSTITANDLASNSVTSAKIADGTVVNADIAAGAAIALSKLEKDPSTAGTINNSTNPVDWTKLKSVPAGFADGVDNTGGTPDPNTVGTTQIIDSTITASDLASNAVTTAKIADGAVTSVKVADGTIGAADLAANSVGTAKIVDSTITLNDLNTASVDTRYVTLGTSQTITGEKTFSDTITASHITSNGHVQGSSVTVDGAIAYKVNTITLVQGNNNNINIGDATFVRITGTPANTISITGIQGGYDGRYLILYNTTSENMRLRNENANSTAANRIRTLGGNNFSTNGTGAMMLVYSGTDSRWVILSRQN